jgi:glycosyltransferase involved in cell wall biosynthesis
MTDAVFQRDSSAPSGCELSVVVPVKNMQRYLASCLDSLLGQTSDSFEVIVVDYGSTDATPAICASYARRDERFSVLTARQASVSAARNAGFARANGSWILFVDADDTLRKDAVEKLLSRCDGADIVSFGWSVVSQSDGRILDQRGPAELASGTQDDLLREVCRCRLDEFSWEYLFSRKLLAAVTPDGQRGPFPERHELFEDSLLLHRILHSSSCKVAFLPEALYRYREGGISRSRASNPRLARDGLSAVRELEAYRVDGDLAVYWTQRLIDKLFFVDGIAGPGLGDGQRDLHRQIEAEIRSLSSSFSFRSFSPYYRALMVLMGTRLLRLVRSIPVPESLKSRMRQASAGTPLPRPQPGPSDLDRTGEGSGQDARPKRGARQ